MSTCQKHGRSKRQLLNMSDSVFDQLLLQIFKTTLTKLGRFMPTSYPNLKSPNPGLKTYTQ